MILSEIYGCLFLFELTASKFYVPHQNEMMNIFIKYRHFCDNVDM